MKRLFALSLSAILLITGCGKQEAAPADDASSKDMKLTFISSSILENPEGTFEQKIIDEFNEMDNGITVEVQGVASNDLTNKLVALAASNDLPDITMGFDDTMVTLSDMGILNDVDQVMGKEYMDGFTDIYSDTFSIEDIRCGVPYAGIAQGMIYREDIFEEKGIEPPKTWDDLVEAAKKCTTDDTYGIAIVGTRNSSGETRFQQVARNFGMNEFFKDDQNNWQTDIGNDQYVAALKAYGDLNSAGLVPPGVIETGYPEAVSLFSSGKAAMLITGSNALGAIISQVPDLDGKIGSVSNVMKERQVSTGAGTAFFITTADQERQKAIAEFLKFVLKPENTIEYAALTGRLPTRTEAFEDPKLQEISGLEGFIEALEYIYIAPKIPGYNEVLDIHGEAYQSVLLGDATPEQASEKAKERAQGIVDAVNE